MRKSSDNFLHDLYSNHKIDLKIWYCSHIGFNNSKGLSCPLDEIGNLSNYYEVCPALPVPMSTGHINEATEDSFLDLAAYHAIR